MRSSLRLLLNILASVRSGALRTLTLEAKVGFIYFPVADDPEVLLQADWGAVCREIARVMATDGQCARKGPSPSPSPPPSPSTFEFKLTYRHIASCRTPSPAQEAEEQQTLQRRCQGVVARLHERNFSALRAVPGIRLTSPGSARLVRDVDDDPGEGEGEGMGFFVGG